MDIEETAFIILPNMPFIRATARDRDWATEFATLKKTIKSSIKNEDLQKLAGTITIWQDLIQTSPDFIYQEVALISPLALAIQQKRRKVIEFLIKECNLRLEAFHSPGCQCRLCQRIYKDCRFLLRYADLIIRSITSPYYILSAHADEVIEFSLSIVRNVRRYKEFLTYECLHTIQKNLEEVMIISMECTSSEKEIRYLFRGYEHEFMTREEKALGRVTDLVDARLKRVLHHSAPQSILLSEWFGKETSVNHFLRRIDNSSYPLQLIEAFICFIIFLPLAIIFPHPKLVGLINTPVVRLQMDFISFWLFLAFGVVTTTFTYSNVLMICKEVQDYTALHRLIIFQSIFACLLASKVFRFCTGIIFTGKRMLIGGFDRLHFLSILFYCIGNVLILISVLIIPKHHDEVVRICKTILKVPNITYIEKNCAITQKIYSTVAGLPLDITVLTEPYIIGSVLLACGHLSYFVSAGHAFYMVHEIAIFIIAMQKMVMDVVKWTIFFITFLIGWSIAMQMLYSGYRCSNTYFNNLANSVAEVYWIVFAMTGTTDYQLTSLKDEQYLWSRNLIQSLGTGLYVSFFVVGTLVLVNLLIALMSVTYQNIEDEKVKEICYWQSKVRIKYILWKDSLPVPYNLLYPVYILTSLLRLAFSRRISLRTQVELANYNPEEDLDKYEIEFLLDKQRELIVDLDESLKAFKGVRMK